MFRNLAMALAAVFFVVGLGATATPAATVLQIAQEDMAQCRDTAYDACKRRECDARSQYCTGKPADIESSPCFGQEIASCAPQKAAQCRDTAYDACKRRECDARSQYCTGNSADIERSPCYGQEIASCITK